MFHFILSKIAILDKVNGKFKIDPSPTPKIKDGKMARFCPSRGFILDCCGGGGGGGDGCLLFHFILSKIVAPHTCLQDYLKQFAGKGVPTHRVNSFAFFALFLSFVLPLHLNFLCWALIRLYSILYVCLSRN